MNNGAWWATAHGVAESDMTEYTCIQEKKKNVQMPFLKIFLKTCYRCKAPLSNIGTTCIGSPYVLLGICDAWSSAAPMVESSENGEDWVVA